MKAYFKIFENQEQLPQAPQKFTFPFNYEAHPLCRLAVDELQVELSEHWSIEDFGDPDQQGDEGKMFGVLVARDQKGQLGYLKAYSGKLKTPDLQIDFVPFVYDAEDEDGFLKQGEEEVLRMGREIASLENDPEFKTKYETYRNFRSSSELQLRELKNALSTAKKQRSSLNEIPITERDPEALQNAISEVKARKQALREFSEQRAKEEEKLLLEIDEQLKQIKELRSDRAALSAKLQKQLFTAYTILNSAGEEKSLSEIFKNTLRGFPPAGSGDCAAPKLLQFAFSNQLEPVAMAEFWWGQSPATKLRKHGQFYPACKGKCEPILGHMLMGIETDPDPMADHPSVTLPLPVIYEDEWMLAVHKPSGLLSVPGKQVEDSVYMRMLEKYPEAEDHMIVHRLDLATSGVMLLAKDKETHRSLQEQFTDRSIKKLYVALLNGLLTEDKGVIELPLRVDLDNRPQQMVCYEHGKAALTHWLKFAEEEGKTRVHFFPLTGRTHQLRVHAAHPSGLNTPIVGDEIYGQVANRLHLHAKEIKFVHPITGKQMKIKAEEEF